MTVCCNSRMLLLPFLSAGMLAFSRNQTWSCSVTHCSDCTTAYPVPLLTPLSLARVHLSSPPFTRLCPHLLTPSHSLVSTSPHPLSLACVHISSPPLTRLYPPLLTPSHSLVSTSPHPLSLACVHVSSPPSHSLVSTSPHPLSLARAPPARPAPLPSGPGARGGGHPAVRRWPRG